MWHFYIDCPVTKCLWKEVVTHMNTISSEAVKQDPVSFLTSGVVQTKPGHVKNFIALLFKWYLYVQRCLNKTPNFTEFRATIYQIRNIEKYNAEKSGMQIKHNTKWYPDLQGTEQSPSNESYIINYIENVNVN